MSAQHNVPIITILKATEIACLALGPALTAYYVFSFTVDKYGYYYKDTEIGIAIGVFAIAVGRAIRYGRG